MCDYDSAPQAPVRSNNSLALPFAIQFLFKKIREPLLFSKKTLEITHCALLRLPYGFRIYENIREHQTLLICQKKAMFSCIYCL